MFFTILLILWLVFLGLALMEMKVIKAAKNSETAINYGPIKLGIILLSGGFAVVYGWNLSGNVNIQNIVMTTLMGITVILSIFITPKLIAAPENKTLRKWLIFRNVIAIINTITMFVHFIIFVVLA